MIGLVESSTAGRTIVIVTKRFLRTGTQPRLERALKVKVVRVRRPAQLVGQRFGMALALFGGALENVQAQRLLEYHFTCIAAPVLNLVVEDDGHGKPWESPSAVPCVQ